MDIDTVVLKAKETLDNAYMNSTQERIANTEEIDFEKVPNVTADDLSDCISSLEVVKEDITTVRLGKTRIGSSVNRIRLFDKDKYKDVQSKSGNVVDSITDDSISRCSELVSYWKKRAMEQKKADPATGDEVSSDKKWVYNGPQVKEPRRHKAVVTLYTSFTGNHAKGLLDQIDSLVLSNLCVEIENALYNHHIKTNDDQSAYYDQLRSLKSNLIDPNNPDFRSAVYFGVHTVEALATISSLDMASKKKKRSRDIDAKNALEACQSDWELRNVPRSEGQFMCGKCKTKKTSYVQLQTRSSDEPMTTYVTCNNCGNRWKF